VKNKYTNRYFLGGGRKRSLLVKEKQRLRMNKERGKRIESERRIINSRGKEPLEKGLNPPRFDSFDSSFSTNLKTNGRGPRTGEKVLIRREKVGE